MTKTLEQHTVFEEWMSTAQQSVQLRDDHATRTFIEWLDQQNISYRLNDERKTIEILAPHVLDSVEVNLSSGDVRVKSTQSFLNIVYSWALNPKRSE